MYYFEKRISPIKCNPFKLKQDFIEELNEVPLSYFLFIAAMYSSCHFRIPSILPYWLFRVCNLSFSFFVTSGFPCIHFSMSFAHCCSAVSAGSDALLETVEAFMRSSCHFYIPFILPYWLFRLSRLVLSADVIL